jgi:lysophospholipase L1-like esterase
MTVVSLDLYPAEAGDPDTLSDADAALLLDGAPWKRLVVIGDSVAAGTREPLAGYRDMHGSERLASWLGIEWHQLGVPGMRIDEVVRTQMGPALDLRPDLAIVAAGGNDALARSFDPRVVAERLMGIVGPLAMAGALVVTVGLFDLPRSGLVPPSVAEAMAERFDRLDAVTRDVVTTLGGLHVDNHSHPAGRDPGIYSSDGIHCNARGHAVWAANMARALATRIP